MTISEEVGALMHISVRTQRKSSLDRPVGVEKMFLETCFVLDA